MQFTTLSEFLEMGGYGIYVWVCFGFTFLILGVGFIRTRFRYKRLMKELARYHERETLRRAS